MKNRFLVFLLLVSSLAYGDRMQNDNIDMQGNAIKNADVQGGTASNTSRITVPKAATATLDGLTRKEGTVVFDSTTKKLKVDNGTTLAAVGSGEGGGGLNAVTNPTAATDLTGYSDSDADAAGNDYIRTDTAAELPLNPAVTTGIKIVPDASSEYIAYCGTMPEALQNRKLRFNQFQKVESGYDSGDMRLEIYPSTSSTCASVGTEYALNKDSSGVTAIPSATQDFWVTFDADGSDYFQIRWVRTNASAEYIVVQNVSIGTGDQASGVPEHGWTAYTPTISALTTTSVTGKYRRVNDTLEAYVYVDSGGSASGTIAVSLPSGLTIDTAKLATTNQNDGALGIATGYSGSAYRYGTSQYRSTTTVAILDITSADYWGTTVPWTWDSGDSLSIRFTVPIAEWGDSSNVVHFGSQDLEYAYFTGTVDASSATDGSATAYGPQGVAMSALSDARSKYIKWQSPPQNGDIITAEIQTLTTGWSDSIYLFVYNSSSTSWAGVRFVGNDANGVSRFDFGRYVEGTTDWGASQIIRFKKISGSHFPGVQYATATTSGLVRNGGAPTSLAYTDLTSQTNCTIDSGDVTLFKVKKIDNVVTIFFRLETITISAASNFRFTLPAAVPRPTSTVYGTAHLFDNTAAFSSPVSIAMDSSGILLVAKSGSGSFTGGANSNYLYGQLSWSTE